MKRLLWAVLFCSTSVFAGEKSGMPLAGVPGWPPDYGFCVSVKGADYFGCVAVDHSILDASLLKDITRSMLQSFNGRYAPALAIAADKVIFPELGDAWDPKASGYCVCAADAQSVDIGGSPFERPSNSGKGGCSYWETCYVKGVPGPK